MGDNIRQSSFISDEADKYRLRWSAGFLVLVRFIQISGVRSKLLLFAELLLEGADVGLQIGYLDMQLIVLPVEGVHFTEGLKFLRVENIRTVQVDLTVESKWMGRYI